MGGLKKKRRIQLLIIGAVLMTAATTMVIFAFDPAYFKTPPQVLAEQPSPEQRLRLGGFVAEGSLIRGQGKTVMFDVTAEGQSIQVAFTGILPDLFREGQGVIAEGYYREGRFEAAEVLAKHDENYMPRELADQLKKEGHFRAEGQ